MATPSYTNTGDVTGTGVEIIHADIRRLLEDHDAQVVLGPVAALLLKLMGKGKPGNTGTDHRNMRYPPNPSHVAAMGGTCRREAPGIEAAPEIRPRHRRPAPARPRKTAAGD